MALCFFFNDTATAEIYTLSLHDALPIFSSVPYDVVSTEEARQLAAGNPLSFLRVTRSELDLPPDTDPYSARVYQKADRKSTRLNSSHANISYAVFCLKKNNTSYPPSLPC